MSSTKRIEALTPEQSARLGEWAEKWRAIGLSTEPTNKERAEHALNLVYESAGLQPARIVWCSSPLAGALTQAVLQNKRVRDSVRDRVRDSVGASVWASVWASVRDSVWDSVGASVGAACYGQHDAEWLGFYEFFREVVGLVPQTDKLLGLIACAKEIGWFWPHEKICWATPRPVALHRDDRGRLHNPAGLAIAYPDGWGLYAWHGTRVLAQVILSPESLTIAQITAEQNAEVRRVMLERFGQDRYIRESGAILLHQDDWGQLYRAEIVGDEPLVMVKMVNSTPEPDGSFKDYWLRVPPTMQTAHQAVAWTCGFNRAEDYAPVKQT